MALAYKGQAFDFDGAQGKNLVLHNITGSGDWVSTIGGIAGFMSANGDKRIAFWDDQLSSLIKVPRLDRAESVTGQYTFAPTIVQAPFLLSANAQGQLVTGLNADKLDGFDTSQTETASTVAVRDSSGRIAIQDPAGAMDGVNLRYLRANLRDADDKGSVRCGTIAALPTYTFTANVLTASANGAFPTQDSVTLALNDLIIVLWEGAGSLNYYLGGSHTLNGIYKLTQIGDATNPWKLTRAVNADVASEVSAGMFCFISEGMQLKNSTWGLFTDDPINLRTDAPDGLTATAVAGGTLTAGTYYYRVSMVDYSGFEASTNLEVSGTTAAGNLTLNLNWNSYSEAASYRIYRSTTSGSYGATSLAGTATGTTFSDNGVVLTSGSPKAQTALQFGMTGSNTFYSAGNGIVFSGTVIHAIQSANYTTNGLVYANGTTSLAFTAQGVANSVLTANAGAPSFSQTPIINTSLTIGVAGTQAGTLLLKGGTSGTVTHAVAAAAGTWTWTAPISGGTNKYPLTTDGTGVSSWSQLDLTAAVIGTLPTANGGTGTAVAGTQYGVVYYTTAIAMASTVAGTATTLLHGNAAGAPTWSAVSLTADISGVLPIANGGTNATAYGASRVIFMNSGNTAFSSDANLTWTAAGGLTVRVDGAVLTTVMSIEDQTAAAADVGPRLSANGASSVSMGNIGWGWNGAATTDSYCVLYTRGGNSNTEKWRVTSAGILQSNGAQTIQTSSGALTVNGVSGVNLQFNASTKANITTNGFQVNAAATSGSIPYIDSNGVFAQDNANLFWDATNKRLGIGTAVPDTLLHLNGAGVTLKISTTNTTNPGVNLHNSVGTLKASFGFSVSNDVLFLGYGGNTHLNINSSGNVGIGITTPKTLLHISGPFLANQNNTTDAANAFGVVSTAGLAVVDSGAEGQYRGGSIGFGGVSTGATSPYLFSVIKGGKETATAGNYGGYLGLWTMTESSAGASSEKVRITSGGSVGIGTTSPGSLLDVTTTALGTTQTNTSGLLLANTTAAAVGAQQISPAMRWRGFGWKTDVTAASQSVDLRNYLIPVQGTASPKWYLTWESSINGVGYTEMLRLGNNPWDAQGLYLPTGTILHEEGSATNSIIHGVHVAADGNYRFGIEAGGKLFWGTGASVDTAANLYRASTGLLQMDGALRLTGNLTWATHDTYDIGASQATGPKNIWMTGSLEGNPTTAFGSSPVFGVEGIFKKNTAGTYATMVRMEMGKENATDGNDAGFWSVYTRTNAGANTKRINVDSAGVFNIAQLTASTILYADASKNVTSGPSLSNSGVTSVPGRIVWFNVGNGSATTINLAHNFATRDVAVHVYRNATPWDAVLVDIERPDINSIDLKFRTAPASNGYRAAVMA